MPSESPTGVLTAYLLASPRFEWRGETVVVDSRKPLAMLSYLCMQDIPSDRERLAELLWGPGRLLNVRQALYQIRQLPGADEWLQVGDVVSVTADSDVKLFERAIEAEDYATAMAVWRPPLLADLAVPRAPHFKEWLELEASRLESLYLRALEHRAAQLEREGDFEAALAMVKRFMELDPLRESAYRSSMRLNYLLGNREAALDDYRHCLRVLKEELAAEPLPATTSLAETIVAGEPLSVAVSPGHLPPELLRLLQAVVVGRGRLSTRELAEALELDEFQVAERLVELERRRLVDSGGKVTDDIAEEARAKIPEPVRRLLHGRIAQALEDSGVERSRGVIGEHWLGAQRPDLAAPQLLTALREAVTAGSDDEALLLGFRTLWCGDDRQRFEAGMLLEANAERSGDAELQDLLLELLRHLAWELQEDDRLARLDLRRARRMMRLGELQPALELAEEALAIARRLDRPLLLAQALNTVGVIDFMRGDLGGAQARFEENRSAEAVEERYRALNNLGAVAGLRGDFEASYGYLEETLTLARKHRNVGDIGACLNNLAATAERMARYRLAVERLRESRDLARRAGTPRTSLHALINLSQVYLRLGELGPAWNTADEALWEGRERGDDRVQGQALEQLGEIARVAGDLAEAGQRFVEAEKAYESAGDERKQAAARCNLAITELLTGDRAAADDVLAHVEHLDELGLAEIARWFWGQLALMAPDAESAEERACRVTVGDDNPHLALIAALARLRAQLLQPDGQVDGVEVVAERLEGFEVVEAPIGYLLLSQATAGEESQEYRQRALRMLEEQSQGLPASLRESLLALPERFDASLAN